ncbi:hypothetical protein TNCT_359411 [Trichonephila clavata]|uniref:Uncharacterized protein n=1 Tax=Trichonephila clavata TaxID=2740835 RepID=A0A8X6G2M0_TRICU|nr:hypothetical protein TNCT_497821 [Trichonephila clavata]GFR10701.1 hypothetical protein TNCT_359411 [Trichonephila clavata]
MVGALLLTTPRPARTSSADDSTPTHITRLPGGRLAGAGPSESTEGPGGLGRAKGPLSPARAPRRRAEGEHRGARAAVRREGHGMISSPFSGRLPT